MPNWPVLSMVTVAPLIGTPLMPAMKVRAIPEVTPFVVTASWPRRMVLDSLATAGGVVVAGGIVPERVGATRGVFRAGSVALERGGAAGGVVEAEVTLESVATDSRVVAPRVV